MQISVAAVGKTSRPSPPAPVCAMVQPNLILTDGQEGRRTWSQILADVLVGSGDEASGGQEHEAARRNGTWPFYGPRQRIGDRLRAEREERRRKSKEEFDAKGKRMEVTEWQALAKHLGPRSASTAPGTCDNPQKSLREIPSA